MNPAIPTRPCIPTASHPWSVVVFADEAHRDASFAASARRLARAQKRLAAQAAK